MPFWRRISDPPVAALYIDAVDQPEISTMQNRSHKWLAVTPLTANRIQEIGFDRLQCCLGYLWR